MYSPINIKKYLIKTYKGVITYLERGGYSWSFFVNLMITRDNKAHDKTWLPKWLYANMKTLLFSEDWTSLLNSWESPVIQCEAIKYSVIYYMAPLLDLSFVGLNLLAGKTWWATSPWVFVLFWQSNTLHWHQSTSCLQSIIPCCYGKVWARLMSFDASNPSQSEW